MKKIDPNSVLIGVLLCAVVFLFVCAKHKKELTLDKSTVEKTRIKENNCKPVSDDYLTSHFDYQQLRKRMESKYAYCTPIEWGEVVHGVKTRLNTDKKVIALTFDACGFREDGYDSELIEYLRREKIPATLFISGKWIDKYPEIFKRLSDDPLFEIGNHGLEHKPCSVNGRSVYRIEGTGNVGEVVDEIEKNARKIYDITGKKPVYYRSGTAFYDVVATKIADELGYVIVGFNVLGDAGAKFSREEVNEAFLGAEPGSIIIAHMNHPESETAEGVKLAIPELRIKGFTFVKLSDYELRPPKSTVNTE